MFYLDSVYVGGSSISTFDGTDINSTEAFSISFNSIPMNGIIDDVRIYNYARTPAQIAWEYNRGAPVAYYALDECTGATAYDTAPKADPRTLGFNGTISPGDSSGDNDTVGTCSSGTTTEMWNDGTTGKRNASLGFDGTNDYVNMGDPSSGALDIGTQDWTISMWVKTTDANTTFIVSKDNNGNNNTLSIALNYAASNKFTARLIAGSVSYTATSKTSVNDGNWHHLLTVLDRDGNMQTYVDGKADGIPVDVSAQSAQNVSNTYNLYFGRREAGNYYNGLLDEVKIFNYALTAQQIRDDYNQGAVRFGPLEGSPQ
jgi:hypothetical protein